MLFFLFFSSFWMVAEFDQICVGDFLFNFLKNLFKIDNKGWSEINT